MHSFAGNVGIWALIDSFYDHVLFIYNLIKESNRIVSKNESYIKDLKELREKTESFKTKLSRIENKKDTLISSYYDLVKKREEVSVDFTNSYIQNKLSDLDTSSVQDYIEYIPDNIPWRSEEIPLFENSCSTLLENFSAVCVTNLSVKNGFPLSNGLFDIVVIDEASQCDIASAIPLIYRAKRLVIIGDPLQLKHITSVQKFEEFFVGEQLSLLDKRYDYVGRSLFDYAYSLAIKSNLESVILNEHFRCHPAIIKFSNKYFYEPRLGQSLDIKTKPESFKFNPTGISWYHVSGQVSDQRNVNDAEINKIIQLVIQLHSRYPEASIGIVTPFKHQNEKIFNKLSENIRSEIKVDTVHKYQGDEKDIILLSLVVSEGCRPSLSNFINFNAPYLLNVAITRAKSSLFIIGNYNYCKDQGMRQGPTYLSRLANYVESLNRVNR